MGSDAVMTDDLRTRLRALDDHGLSPRTGWTRTHWEVLADHLLLAVRPFATARHGGIALPGTPGGYGPRIDAQEGFARTFLAAAFRVAGEHGRDPLDLMGWYAQGLDAATDPGSPEAWLRLEDDLQTKVEAASVALGLHLTRPWLWDRLDAGVRERVVDYLRDGVRTFYPPINWLWFRVVTQEFLHAVGALDDLAQLRADVATLDGFYRADGWYSDGPERSFDHYAGWAMHLYPQVWTEMAAGRPEADAFADVSRDRLARFLDDAVRLVGADGAPLVQGRSLVYRFATAAPFWLGARAGVGSPGLLRRAASGTVRYFVDQGAVGADGLLSIGWFGPWRPMAQSYSGPGSPYWASKGLLGLVLPADHPVWTAVEEPLPVEQADQGFVVAAPGWQVSATRADGIVRVVNHGTDHSHPGSGLSDPPLYARLGYSTSTWPVVAGASLHQPLDQSVVLLDATGAPSHRTGIEAASVCLLDDVPATRDAAGPCTSLGRSRWQAHWVDPDPGRPDHGFGRPDVAGVPRGGPHLEVVTLLRGEWEVRLVRVLGPVPDHVVSLRVGGWPVTGERVDVGTPTAAERRVASPTAVVDAQRGRRLVSSLHPLEGWRDGGVVRLDDVTPLDGSTWVPWLGSGDAPEPGRWYVAAVRLGVTPVTQALPRVTVSGTRARVRWPDGHADETRI